MATENFTDEELACPDCGLLPPQWVQDELQQLRDEYGHPIVILSGARCPAHHRQVGVAPESRHLALPEDVEPNPTPCAFDVGIPPFRRYDFGAAAFKLRWSVGVKTHHGRQLLHVDRRAKPVLYTYP